MNFTAKKIIPVFLSILFLGLSHTLSAQPKTQKAKVTEGPEVESKRSSVQDISGSDESGYYVVRQEKSSHFIEHINKQMTVDKSMKVPKQKDGSYPMYYSHCSMLEGHLYLFTTSKDSRMNKMKMFVQTVSTSTLIPDGKPKEIASSSYASRRILMQTMISGGSFSYTNSPDDSHMLIYSADGGKEENGEAPKDTKFHLSVFNAQVEKLWDKDVRLPYAPGVFSVEQIKLDDDGNVYIIGIEYEEKAEARISRREGKPSYTYHIFRYSADGKDVLEMPIDLKGKFITDVQIDGAPNGDLIASGFYSEQNSFSVKGAFYMSIDGQTQEIKAQQMTEFESDFITQYYSEKEKKKEKKKEDKGEEPELYQFQLNNLLIRADGGVTLIAEQYYVVTQTYQTYNASTKSWQTYTVYYYYYNDIMVLSFNNKGAIEWKTKIPKRQTTTNDGGYYSSYAYAVVGDKLYFIFNDNPKNLFLKPGEQPYFWNNGKELAVVLVEVTSAGKVTRELLMTTDKTDLIVRPKMCRQTGAREMLICSQRSKVYQFSKVEFQ